MRLVRPTPEELEIMIQEQKKNPEEYWAKYNQQHRRCPNCGSKRFLQFMRACQGYDDNEGGCEDCGWEGIRHQLLPE
jgi:DNA-directed RNA polymerase subunit RPC12/RpoP